MTALVISHLLIIWECFLHFWVNQFNYHWQNSQIKCSPHPEFTVYTAVLMVILAIQYFLNK